MSDTPANVQSTLTAYAPEDVANKEEYINLVKRELVNGKTGGAVTMAEVQFFLQVCQSSGLNPLTRQIYAIFRGGKMTIQTGIDGLRAIAERTGRYAGSKDASFEYDENKKLVRASVSVFKVIDGTVHETTASARYDEYSVPSNPMWKKMPETMLSKCAEAKALRKAFPNIGQIYSDDEMHQAAPPVTEETVHKVDTEAIREDVKQLVSEAMEERNE